MFQWQAHKDATEDRPATDDHDDAHEREADHAESLQEEDAKILDQDRYLDEEKASVVHPDRNPEPEERLCSDVVVKRVEVVAHAIEDWRARSAIRSISKVTPALLTTLACRGSVCNAKSLRICQQWTTGIVDAFDARRQHI